MNSGLLERIGIKCRCGDVLKIECTESEYEDYIANQDSIEDWPEKIKNAYKNVGWAFDSDESLCNGCYLMHTLIGING